ncbi:hypothetical protein [Bacillus pumilus]|uniref:hypothetical protein n=1 Tax=Bacillus pumilus TaxID=1408 RepID=UPI002111DFB5|nr:hypothetical protein [Bacillus pumilus]UUD44621.1 hypothetical protein NPA43_18985 [Bacillus pumilus]
MKTFTLFCIENLIEVIQEKRSIHMDTSTLNLQTTENIQLYVKQVQLMRKAWEDELNLFFVHVNTYGFIYTNPFSNFKKFAFEAISFGMTYLLRQSPIAKKHWDNPIDLGDIADQMIKEISAVECINFHEELDIDEEYVHRSEFLEFGDQTSFKRVYEAGEGIYTLFSKKGHEFNIKELPLYNPELASALMLKENEYHRLLILASIAHGHFNDYLESNDSYDFMNWSLEEFKERAKIETKFYGKGNLSFGGQVDQVKVDSFHHFNLIVDGQIFLHMTVESDNELRAFPHILLNRGEFKERKAFLHYRDQDSYKCVYIEGPNHYSFEKMNGKIFDVRELPLYDKDTVEITSEKGFNIEEYHSYLILASIVNGHLDQYMQAPFHHVIDVRDFSIDDFSDSSDRLKVVMEIYGDGFWNVSDGGSIDGVDIYSYIKSTIILDDELLVEYELESESSVVDKDMQMRTLFDIMFNFKGKLIDQY